MLSEKKKTHLTSNNKKTNYARKLYFIPVSLGRLPEVGSQQVSTMTQVFDITLRAKNGEERNQLQWFPTPATRSELYERWRKRDIKVTDEKEIL